MAIRILNMSITGSLVILFVLLARLLLKKAPKVFSYALWAVVLFRLLCPVSIRTNYSLVGLFDPPAVENSEHTTAVEYIAYETNPGQNTAVLPSNEPSVNETNHSENYKSADEKYEAAGNKTDDEVYSAQGGKNSFGKYDIWTILWLLGIGVMAVYSAVSYILMRRKLVGAVVLRENIYLADGIGSPFVLGVIRPKIYLPSSLSEQERGYIIFHERHHIRRGDHIVKILAFIALCIHWFNPLVWVAFVLASKDMEMSCDEAVVRKLGESVRADYSSSLLSLATGRRIIAGTPLAFGEGDTKSRIKNLLGWKKPKVWAVIAAAIVCAAVFVACTGNPSAMSGQEDNSETEQAASDETNKSDDEQVDSEETNKSDSEQAAAEEANNSESESISPKTPDMAQDLVYYLELAAGENFRDMDPENMSGIMSEYNDLLSDYALIARECEDSPVKYIVGQYIGEAEKNAFDGLYSMELSFPYGDIFQFLYHDEDSEKIEAALAENNEEDLRSYGYRINNSRIFWSADGEIVLIQPQDVEVSVYTPFYYCINKPNGRDYIKDAVSRGIDICGKTDTFLNVYLISENYGEISEHIPLTENEAVAIREEQTVSIEEGFGFSAALQVGEESFYYNEHSGIPQTVLDLAVEKCGYRFERPDMIADTVKEASLKCSWLDAPIYADEEDLPRLHEILKNAKFEFVGGCGYNAKLTLTFDNGEEMTVFKGCDGCDTVVFGSYGGYVLGDEENIEFWEMFGLDPESKLPKKK